MTRAESTTPDLVERVSQQTEAANRGDIEAVTGFYAPDVVFDLSGRGIGIFEGVAACRGFLDDYFGSFEELEWEMGETLVLDNGVLLAVVSQQARPVGVAAQVHTREGWVLGFSVDGLMQSISTYDDIDEARAAADRLAEARGYAMSENLELVRAIYGAWERDDYSSVDWADPEIEFALADGPDPESWTGVAGMVEGWRAFKSTWEDFRAEPEEYRDLDHQHVLVLVRFNGRAKTSGLDLAQMRTLQASLFQIRASKVTRLILYFDSDRAFADLGLKE